MEEQQQQLNAQLNATIEKLEEASKCADESERCAVTDIFKGHFVLVSKYISLQSENNTHTKI